MVIEQETCETVKGLFNTLTDTFKLQHNEMISSLQYCKLVRHLDESAEQWTGRLRIKAT